MGSVEWNYERGEETGENWKTIRCNKIIRIFLVSIEESISLKI